MAIDTDIGLPAADYGVAGQPRQAFGSFTGDSQHTVVAGVPDKRLAIWSLTLTPKSADVRTYSFASGADILFTMFIGGTATSTSRQHRSRDPRIPLFVVSAGADLRVASDKADDLYDVSVIYSVVP